MRNTEMTIREMIQNENVPQPVDIYEEVTEQQPQGIGIDLSILKAKTGEGSVESYINHPLNFNESKAVARILRGLTGMFGSLEYAIIDITIGLLEYMKGKRQHVNVSEA